MQFLAVEANWAAPRQRLETARPISTPPPYEYHGLRIVAALTFEDAKRSGHVARREREDSHDQSWKNCRLGGLRSGRRLWSR